MCIRDRSDRFDQLELLVESCVKSIRQMRTIKRYQKELEEGYMGTISTLRYIVEEMCIRDSCMYGKRKII